MLRFIKRIIGLLSVCTLLSFRGSLIFNSQKPIQKEINHVKLDQHLLI